MRQKIYEKLFCAFKGATIQSLHPSTLIKRIEKREYYKLLEVIYILHFLYEISLTFKTYTKSFLFVNSPHLNL